MQHRAWLVYPQIQVKPHIQLLFLLGAVAFLVTWARCGKQCPSPEAVARSHPEKGLVV